MHFLALPTALCALLALQPPGGDPPAAAGLGGPLSAAPEAAALAAGIAWESDWDAAFTRASEEKRVVLLAVNMDGEKANDRLAEKVYTDRAVLDATAETVPLIASRFDHGGGKCSRFDGVSCETHQAIDMKARASVLAGGADGEVVAPQHVLLDGAGKVLLSVAYEIDADELVWCIVTARRMLDAEAEIPMPSGAKAPKRLVMDGVAAASADTVRPLTEEELEEVLKAMRSGSLRGAELVDQVTRLLATDHPDAIDAVEKQLLQWQRGATGGRRGAEAGERVAESRRRAVRRIGELSPESYWEVLTAMLGDSDVEMRHEAAVALEQLAAPEACKELRSRVGKEDVPEVQRAMVRALGSCGAEDNSARKKVLSASEDKKDSLLRCNALFALGASVGDKAVDKRLLEALTEGDEQERRAVALGVAFARKEALREELVAAREAAGPDSPLHATLELSLQVLDGGPNSLIREEITAVCVDTIPRLRWFREGS